MTTTTPIRPSRGWAWLIGYLDTEGERGFEVCEHPIVTVRGRWHSARIDAPVTTCGLYVEESTAERSQSVFTVCDRCAMELAPMGRAFHVPWSVALDVAHAIYCKQEARALEVVR